MTSTVCWRHALAEFRLGIVNRGPGPVYDVQLLPTLSEDGLLDVVTVLGADIDKDVRFVVEEIQEGEKALVTFIFRAKEPMAVRIDCTVIFLRGIADIKEVRLPGRWIELEGVELLPGEDVEPERALELASQHAAFHDRAAFYMPRDRDPELLFSAAIDALKDDLRPVVELEDEERTQFEAWFHAELRGGGTVVASVTVMPGKGISDIYAACTLAGVVPGTMVRLRKALARAAKQPLREVLDPELMASVPREGVLLFDSWGTLD